MGLTTICVIPVLDNNGNGIVFGTPKIHDGCKEDLARSICFNPARSEAKIFAPPIDGVMFKIEFPAGNHKTGGAWTKHCGKTKEGNWVWAVQKPGMDKIEKQCLFYDSSFWQLVPGAKLIMVTG